MRVTWLPEVLRAAGLQVVEEPGWRGRGVELHGVDGLIGHHTACGPHGDCPSTRTLIFGRPDLRGPLAQLQLCRSGIFHMIADGKANHAGDGSWPGIGGNADTIGIEAENEGDGDDEWPAVQVDSFARGVAAIFGHVRLPASRFCAHYEWARPRGRKPDPRGPWQGGGDWYSGGDFITRNASTFRARVAALLEEDDMFGDEDRARAIRIENRLEQLFGVDEHGNAVDIRKKIDETFVHVAGEDHRDLLAGRVAAIDATVNPSTAPEARA